MSESSAVDCNVIFSDKTEKLLAECLSAFDNTKRMLSAKYGEKFRTELSDDLKGHIHDLKKLNDEKRAAKLLQTPLVLVGSIFILWVAISVFGEFLKFLEHVLTFRTILAQSNCSLAQYWFDVFDILHCALGGRPVSGWNWRSSDSRKC